MAYRRCVIGCMNECHRYDYTAKCTRARWHISEDEQRDLIGCWSHIQAFAMTPEGHIILHATSEGMLVGVICNVKLHLLSITSLSLSLYQCMIAISIYDLYDMAYRPRSWSRLMIYDMAYRLYMFYDACMNATNILVRENNKYADATDCTQTRCHTG